MKNSLKALYAAIDKFAAEVYDLGAFRRNRELKKQPEALSPPANKKELPSETSEPEDYSSDYIANLLERLSFPSYRRMFETIQQINKATQGKYSQSTLNTYIKDIQRYTNAEIMRMLENSNKNDWNKKPTFFHALIYVLKHRKTP